MKRRINRNPELRSSLAILLKRNLGLKLLSVFLSVSFWAWVTAEKVEERDVQVHVDYRFPSDITPVEPGPRIVTVTVRGALGKMAHLGSTSL